MDILETLGITAIFSAALVFVIRKLIEQFFTKDLEKFKAELEKEVIRHKTQFETLHTERAVVIKEVYKRTVKTQRAFESLINPLQLAGELTEEEKTKQLVETFNDLSNYFAENRLFFGEQLAQEIDGLIKKFMDIWRQWNYARDLKEGKTPDVREWGKAWDQVKGEIPPIRESIEKKFRDIIGIE